MAKLVDTRGRSCPEPLLMTKNAIDEFEGEEIKVLADAMVAVENIKRVAKKEGFQINMNEDGGEYTLLLTK